MNKLIIVSILFSAFNVATAATQSKSQLSSKSTVRNSSRTKSRTRSEFLPPKPATSTINSTISTGNTSITDVSAFTPSIHAGYTGILFGPKLDAERNKSNNIKVSNRLTARADVTETLDAGLQMRLRTTFINSGVTAENEDWRIFANIKKIYSDDIFQFNLTPRVALPTSNGAHNSTMILAPELIAAFNFTPRNSRFSFSYSAQTQKNIYSNYNAVADSLDFLLVHNIEASYTLSPTAEISVGLFPEYSSTNIAAFTNSGNELDLGFNWSFTKGWSLNPYLATELKGLDTANLSKGMQANIVLSGNFL